MILVSQNKEKIINFKIIAEVIVSDKDICVRDNFEVPKGLIIATYESEERAKEVLQEIWKFYEISKRYECSSNNSITLFLEPKFVYEMPKE